MAKPHGADLPALTGLRFLAALWVVVYHLTRQFWPLWPRPLVTLVARGWMGVPFFFILSGFILAHVYGARFAAGNDAAARRAFWWARFARVYPMYLLALVAAWPLYARFLGPAILDPRTVATQLTTPALLQSWFPFVPNQLNAPGWSLCVEAFFYAAFPWMMAGVARLVQRRDARLVAAALWAAGAFVQALAAILLGSHREYWARNLQDFFPPWWMPFFLMGVALHAAWRQAEDRGWQAPAWAPAAVGLVLVVLLAGVPASRPLAYGATTLLAEGLFGVAIVAVAARAGKGVFATAPLVALGEASYGMYLLHLPLNDWIGLALGRSPVHPWSPGLFLGTPFARTGLEFAAFLAALCLLCLALHAAYERPVRRRLLSARS